MKLSDTDLDILAYGLEDHVKELEQYLSWDTAMAIAETKELLNRVRHEQINRKANSAQ